MNREQIYDAVFQFWAGLAVPTASFGGAGRDTDSVSAFKTATRKVSSWDAVGAENTPALLFQQRKEHTHYRKGLPALWTLRPVLFVYVRTNASLDASIIPAQILNPLLDAIEQALVIDDVVNHACTLGGLVSHCAIDGDIEIFQGDQGDDEVATVPLSITVPSAY